jgi:GNAT superfamily N-acetyltransferase
MNTNIRLATIEDIPELRQLIRESVSRLSAGYYSSTQIDSALLHIFGVDTQLIIDGTYFVAEAEGELAGSGGWSKRKTLFGGDQAKGNKSDPSLGPANDPSPDALLNPGTDAARIRAFYVYPKWSRKGVASSILQACEEAARREGFRTIELAATLPGVPFYLARGYQKGEAIPIEMDGGELLPTIRMTKKL